MIPNQGLGTPMVLGVYEFRKCILPYDKRVLDVYKRGYEFGRDLMNITDFVRFTVYLSTIVHKKNFNVIYKNLKNNKNKKYKNWVSTTNSGTYTLGLFTSRLTYIRY